jgi:WXG100 family type VII secretion target
VDDTARYAHPARQRGAEPAAAVTLGAMSALFADPADLYAMAERISRHADALRSNATLLAVAVAKDGWHGSASDVFSAQAHRVLQDMRACARRLDDAADALRRHAGRVQHAFEQIRRWWHDVEQTGESVLHAVRQFVIGDGDLVVDGAFAELLDRGGN